MVFLSSFKSSCDKKLGYIQQQQKQRIIYLYIIIIIIGRAV